LINNNRLKFIRIAVAPIAKLIELKIWVITLQKQIPLTQN